MVSVIVVLALSAMVLAVNTLVIDGGTVTVRVAEAVVPLPPFEEVTLPVKLT
jgi:hypothetical protein